MKKQSVINIIDNVVQNIKSLQRYDYLNNDLIASSIFCAKMCSAQKQGIITYENEKFFIAEDNDDMDKLIRLAVFMPEVLTITNISSKVYKIDGSVFFSKETERMHEYELYCCLPERRFINWFLKTRELFENGLVKYYPNTLEIIKDVNGLDVANDSYMIKKEETYCTGCAVSGTIENTSYPLSEIIKIEIPYIYDISLETFTQIVLDNLDQLKRFQIFFSANALNIDPNNKAEKLAFQYELQQNVLQIANAYKTDIAKVVKSFVMSSLHTLTVYLLICPDKEILLQNIIGLIGGYGILNIGSSIYDLKINKIKIKENACYLLWLFSKK